MLSTYKGSDLEFIMTRHPFYDREAPLILGEHVTLDAGTGCDIRHQVMVEDDFYIGQKYGLDILNPIDDKGYFTEEAPGFEGLFYDEGNKAITKSLRKWGHY